jgi:tetratricopeptide (TPR) repeat protein
LNVALKYGIATQKEVQDLNIDEFVAGLDTLFDAGRIGEVEGYFEAWMNKAEEEQDQAAQVTILNEMMGFFRETSQYDKSIESSKKALALMKDMGLENTQAYATTLLNSANALRAAGELEQSAAYYGQVFAMFETLVEPEDFAYAELYNNVALLYQELGYFDRAVQSLQNALAICLQTPGKEFQTAVTYANLGTSELNAGDLQNAVVHLQEADRMFESFGVNDSHHAAAVAAMADAMCRQGNYSGARAGYQRALDMIEQYIGRNEAWNRVQESLQQVPDEADQTIKGMDLAIDFYETLGKDMLHEKFPEQEGRIAVGKAGAGSECFGFDDEYSRDHDFGPGFSMWLTEEDYQEIGEQLNQEYQSIYRQYITAVGREHFPQLDHMVSVVNDPNAGSRTGARRIGDFFQEHTGYREGPKTEGEWLLAEEAGLAAAVNGQVFRDDAGSFTAIREQLQNYYPERVRLLKIAQNITMLGQAAQYNLGRCIDRKDFVAAELERSKAIRCALNLIYLLNRSFAPHDKWLRQGIRQLPILSELGNALEEAALLPIQDKTGLVEKLEGVCQALLEETKQQGVVSGSSSFLPDYAEAFAFRAGLYNKSIEELAEDISVMEFEAFDKVQNEGGRAGCQDDWETFHIMRKSQYLTWTKEMLIQYIVDFRGALERGWNMITEKYGRMMETTVPWEYEGIRDSLPYVSDEKKAIVNEIVRLQVEWMEQFAAEYPGLAQNARIIHTSEDKPWDTSYETYLRGELLTYSDTMLLMYGRFIVFLRKNGENLAYQIMDNTVKMYGYKGLTEAQKLL